MRDEAARALAESILAPGEKLLWVQAAPPWPIAEPAIAFVVIFGLLLGALIAFRKNLAAATAYERWWLRALVAMIFVVFGFTICFGVFQTISAWSTAYAVTNQRVVIVSNSPWLWRRDYGPDVFARYSINGDTIDFDWGSKRRSRQGYREHLYGLADPDAVAALITAELAPQALRADEN